MKLRQYAARSSIVVLAFVLGALSVCIYPFKLSKPNVTIDVLDRRYACGDCYVRFGVLGILNKNTEGGEDRSTSPNRFDGWDILVAFKGNTSYLESYQEEQFAKDQSCGWPTFRLKGQFKRRLIYAFMYDGDHYDGIYFDAQSGVAINTSPDCKDHHKEVSLP